MAIVRNSSFALTFHTSVLAKSQSGGLNKGVFGLPVSGHGVSWNVRQVKSGAIRHGVVRAVAEVSTIKKSKSLDLLGLDVVAEGELREKGFLGMRKTKLVCTIGPACCSSEELERLAMGGMNVARLNMCHGTREWHRNVIRRIKKLNEQGRFCVSVMIDTEGSQIFVVDHGAPSSLKAEEGSIWLFTAKKFEGSLPFTVQANYEGFSEGIIVGDELVIDGGMASFEVIEKIGHDLRCVDLIAMSFVNDADSVKHLKNCLSSNSAKSIKVLAKIESLDSLQKLEEIAEASDGIMVARGDLGVEIPLEQIPTVQEEITHICRQLNKPVIIASQLLESMVEYPTPTRAEVADVSEAVRQYADALMLSGESAIGSYGQKALSVLQMVSSRMELWSREENRQSNPTRQLGELLHERIAEEICNSAVEWSTNGVVDWVYLIISLTIYVTPCGTYRCILRKFAIRNEAEAETVSSRHRPETDGIIITKLDEEPPESLFMKELKRRGMTPTSLLEDTNRGSYGVEDEIKLGEEDRGFPKKERCLN
ncbi:hypothetical protein GH714_009173 [Hevea brasiliensis]|uniref:pyruvate kinase n=1 Tax=Hevea brasiliensis TaxID=3981 RepID=A0A6A6KZ18_HEVBR|nr:hypothetical protein GH714_009173 [Hevea brasiliensis]